MSKNKKDREEYPVVPDMEYPMMPDMGGMPGMGMMPGHGMGMYCYCVPMHNCGHGRPDMGYPHCPEYDYHHRCPGYDYGYGPGIGGDYPYMDDGYNPDYDRPAMPMEEVEEVKEEE